MEKKMAFEESLERLEEIVKKLESGSEGLEASLALYEEGVLLIRSCTKRLENAQQKVQMLQLTPDGGVLVDFSNSEEKE